MNSYVVDIGNKLAVHMWSQSSNQTVMLWRICLITASTRKLQYVLMSKKAMQSNVDTVHQFAHKAATWKSMSADFRPITTETSTNVSVITPAEKYV